MRDHLHHRALTLAHRPVALARLNIPLDVDLVQQGGLNLTGDQLATLQQLWAEGVRTIERHSELRLAFLRERFPELRRGVVLRLELNKVVFTGRATAFGMSVPKFDVNDTHYIVPEFGNLDQDQRAALIIWLERLVRQERMHEVVKFCARDIIMNPKRTPTVAHMLAIWPTVGSLIDPSAERHPHQRKQLEEWRERFRNPPLRNKQLYVPDGDFMATWSGRIKVADTQIAQGMVLSEIKDEGPIKARVEQWQRIDGDIAF